MTAFTNFVISNYPHLIEVHPTIPNKLYFCCAAASAGLCSSCPNESKGYSCNYFTESQTSYIISAHPELLL